MTDDIDDWAWMTGQRTGKTGQATETMRQRFRREQGPDTSSVLGTVAYELWMDGKGMVFGRGRSSIPHSGRLYEAHVAMGLAEPGLNWRDYNRKLMVRTLLMAQGIYGTILRGITNE